jgi:hypothetical protein
MSSLMEKFSRVTEDRPCPVRHRDLRGQRFGSRTVVQRCGRAANGNALWLIKCDCGRECIVRADALRASKQCPSCSGKTNGTRHGECHTYEYGCWCAMRDRLRRHPSYAGLPFQREWGSFLEFSADMGAAPSTKHTLDRIDGSKGYVRGNVRWATKREQANNTKTNRCLTFNGHEATLSEWSRRLGIGKTTIRERLRRGWSVERALTEAPK